MKRGGIINNPKEWGPEEDPDEEAELLKRFHHIYGYPIEEPLTEDEKRKQKGIGNAQKKTGYTPN